MPKYKVIIHDTQTDAWIYLIDANDKTEAEELAIHNHGFNETLLGIEENVLDGFGEALSVELVEEVR